MADSPPAPELVLLPERLDDSAFEALLAEVLPRAGRADPLQFEGRRVRTVTPFAAVGLRLLADQHSWISWGKAPEVRSRALIQPTRIATHEEVHGVVDHVMESSTDSLSGFGFTRMHAALWTMLLAELCQNVIEHAQALGWVASWFVGHGRQGATAGRGR